MRIAIDVRSLIDGRLSGVEVYTINIIRALTRLAPQHSYHLFYNAARAVQLPAFTGPVQIHAFRFPNKLFNATQSILHRPRWDTLVPADCFFVPNLRLMPLSSAAPLVTTVHDISYKHFPHFFSWKRRVWHFMMRTKVLLKRSNHLIAVSSATARDIQDIYGINSQKISVIHSGLSLQSADTATVRRTYALPARYILFMGTLEPRKNVVSIIKAFSAVAPTTECHLVIAGSAGWLTPIVDEVLAQSTFQDRIHRIGFIAEKDKAALYAEADLFVYPSFYEGFGFPPLEALRLGTPVITSFNSSLPEVVGKWATLVDPYDVAELAAVLQQVLQKRQRVSAIVQEEISTLYSWEDTARKTLKVIEETV